MFDAKTRDIAICFAISTAVILVLIVALKEFDGGYLALLMVLAGVAAIDYEYLSVLCPDRNFNFFDIIVMLCAKFIMTATAMLMYFASHKHQLATNEIQEVTSIGGVLTAFFLCDSAALGIICMLRWLSREPVKPE